ncbi:molybdopterin-dependent oxidoreductase [Pseudoteredinibacter isoporae]|uniref:molybdopterin-dependent oxidoreductase n=1 Tax=Pseudoteredinibacter isoporae TaxID=570281 RepID=UPI003104BCC2
MSANEIKTHYRACNLCEAICGIEIKTQGDEILSIKGDKNDPLGRGHICPKAVALQDLHNDPERLRKPVKKVDGQWQEISWEEAIEMTADGIVKLQQAHGRDALAIYAGNPNVHNYGSLTHGSMLSKLLRSKNRFSATSLDQLPCQLVCYWMYGHQLGVPIADIDQCDFFVIMGGNPMASNGSMMTVPDIAKRLKAIKQRDGEVLVIDPRRSETAEVASEHWPIRPGSDAFLLMAIIHTLFEENLVRLGHLEPLLKDIADIEHLAKPFKPELIEAHTGIRAEQCRELARKLANTERAAFYGRMGISTQQYGTLCNWAIQIINILAGNLDKQGGTLLTHPAVGMVKPGEAGAGNFGRWKSRVSQLPEFNGEIPAAAMAEEMLTEGEGQAKGLFIMAGNPVSSSPNGQQLDKALEQLDFMVAVDIYINETTRHADVILPPTTTLEHDHFDLAFLRLAVRNTVRFNEAVFEPGEGSKHDWQIFNELAAALAHKQGIDFQALPEPKHIIDFAIQMGPYGEAADNDWALNVDELNKHQHGLDLGPLKPSLTEGRLCTEDGLIHCLPELIPEDVSRLEQQLNHTARDGLLLIGRRHVRDCNSWMHNSHRLTKGKDRWQLYMHPDDLIARGINDGDTVSIQSRVGQLNVAVKATDEMMPGVVSIPHGWGHNSRKGVKMSIANEQAGVNCNDLTDEKFYDQVSGNAALNGVPVEVKAI